MLVRTYQLLSSHVHLGGNTELSPPSQERGGDADDSKLEATVLRAVAEAAAPSATGARARPRSKFKPQPSHLLLAAAVTDAAGAMDSASASASAFGQ